MAQVGVQQPSNLIDMFSSASPMLWGIAAQQVNDQTLGNALNRAQANQDMTFEAQKQPFELSRLGLQNDTLGAQLPGVKANSSMLEDKASLSRETLPQQKNTALKKLLSEASTADLDIAENHLKQLSISNNPAERKWAQERLPDLYEVRKERVKQEQQHNNRMSEIEATISGQERLEKMRIEAGKYKKNDKFTIDLETRIDAEADPAKKMALLIDAASKANQAGDIEATEAYMARAQSLDNLVKMRSNALPKPGAVDVSGVTQGQVPTNPVQSAMPTPQTKSNEIAAPKTQAEYDALPSGTIYVDTDGKTKRKK